MSGSYIDCGQFEARVVVGSLVVFVPHTRHAIIPYSALSGVFVGDSLACDQRLQAYTFTSQALHCGGVRTLAHIETDVPHICGAASHGLTT
jgi:hypothetical protein